MTSSSSVLARRGVPRGCASQPIGLASIADALRLIDEPRRVFVEPCEGALRASRPASLAEVAVRCRLSPDHHSRSVSLSLSPPSAHSAPASLFLRVESDLAPHDELLLWPDEQLLARMQMPFLTLNNVLASACASGGVSYVCDVCSQRFDEPHALKLHLWVRCRPYSARDFWTRLSGALDADPGPIAAPTAAAATAGPSPAALEALATAWGRVAGGHLCLYCGKVYSRRYGLKIHIRTHTGYKPLRCRHCARRFGDPSNLNKHVRLHASADASRSDAASSHACRECGAACARRRDLMRHLRAKHHTPP